MEFINRIEASLLNDLLELYQDDLRSEEHSDLCRFCLACCKGRIIAAILRYQLANAARRLSKPEPPDADPLNEALTDP